MGKQIAVLITSTKKWADLRWTGPLKKGSNGRGSPEKDQNLNQKCPGLTVKYQDEEERRNNNDQINGVSALVK